MHILHLTLSYAYGGRRQMIENLAGALERCGQRCAMAVVGDEPGPASKLFGVVHALDRKSIFDWQAVGRLHELCHEEQVDILHAHDGASQFLTTLLRLRHPRLAPPTLMTFHRSLNIGSKTWRDRLRNRLACAVAGPVVAVSEERRRQYIRFNRINSRRVFCIPNGTDVERFRPCPATRTAVRGELGIAPADIVVGAAGHFGREKGLDIVLRAFRLMLETTPTQSFKLLILGDGHKDGRAELERLAANCQGRASFLGYQADAHRWFQAFDIFLHGPRQEAFGLVVTESMATGVPVVAARVGGIPEIIQGDAFGRLVEPESPAAMAQAALQLVMSPAVRHQIGQQGRDRVRERFTVETQARRYLRLYEMLRAGRRSFDASARAHILNGDSLPAYAVDPYASRVDVSVGDRIEVLS